MPDCAVPQGTRDLLILRTLRPTRDGSGLMQPLRNPPDDVFQGAPAWVFRGPSRIDESAGHGQAVAGQPHSSILTRAVTRVWDRA